MKFDLIIFDNDGVLVDSEPIANRTLQNLLFEYGWPISFEETVERFMGGTMARARSLIEAYLQRSLPTDFEARYYEELFRRFPDELVPVRGIVETLETIRTPTCVASSGSHERISRSLKVTGLWERFEGRIFSAEDVRAGKPAPDLFLLAAAHMGVSPERAAVVEDSPLGVEAANAAGMTAFGYAALTPVSRLHEATGGVFVDMLELPALIDSVQLS